MDTLSEGEIGMLNETAKLQNRIIAAAVALFRKLGYEKTTVNDICREADIARSTFYLNFAGKKEIIGKILSDVRLDREDFFDDFISAANDFERMWILCNRFLTVATEFGPELTGALFGLELLQEARKVTGQPIVTTHKVDEWMIQLTSNCQNAGVILSPESAETIAPIGVDIAYYTTYEWCKKSGAFPLRRVVRRRAEAVYNVAPEYRMSDKELDRL